MTSPRSLARTALAVSATLLPLAAQTPLFNDGTAFGGSRVFSEGINPLGNPARFDQPLPGWYMSFVDGDQRAQDNKAILQDTLSPDATIVSAALARLKDAPYALRTRAYGITGVKEGTNFGFTREEFHSALAFTDLDPLHLGSAVHLAGDGTPTGPGNATYLDARRAIVNRLHFGGGTLSAGTSAGFNLRIEQWSMGTITPYLNQNAGVYTFSSAGNFPFTYSADDLAMGYATTTMKTLTIALDGGFTTELAQGLRVGVMVDRLNAKRLWDVDLKTQYRGALQIDLGPNTLLTVESDVNAVARMPFPVKQQSSSASLRYQVSPAVIFLVGAERRKIGDASVTRAGATLQLRTQSMFVAFGFQAGQDRPMKGLALMVN
jgi:hypothetical protein